MFRSDALKSRSGVFTLGVSTSLPTGTLLASPGALERPPGPQMGTMGVLVGVLMGSCAPHGDAVGPLIAAPASPYFLLSVLIFYSAFLFFFSTMSP